MMISPGPLPVRVLLVDDEVQQLAVRAHVMRASGLSVITASGPIEAIRILAGGIKKIEIAILDYDMLVMNGCVLAGLIRFIRPRLKIILYSGAIDIAQSKMASVDAFVPKGDTLGTLINQVVLFTQATAGADSYSLPGMEA